MKISGKIEKPLDYLCFICYNIDRLLYTEKTMRHANAVCLLHRLYGAVCTNEFSDKFMITDLPGYGYAKISKSAQEAWQRNLENYLKNRKQIKCVIQLIDARHDVQKNDLQMRAWLDAQGIRAITVVTKIDCVPRRDITKIVNNVKKIFNDDVLPFSSKDRYYCESTLNYLLNLCE